MPSPLTSSFASAAAGNTLETATNRREGTAEWSRSRTNGATQTFRRPSLATTPSHTRETTQPAITTPSSNTGVYIPPHMNSNYQSGTFRNGANSDTRYSKDQLIGMYKNQKESGNLSKNLSELFLGGWNPAESRNGATASWGKREDSKDAPTGPEVCWDTDGRVQPLGLSQLSEEEKEIFESVNSPLKAPAATKDGTPNATTTGRKSSISQNGQYNASPHSGRPGPRRRETGDSISGVNPVSPTGNTRFFRDEPAASTPPAALLRRKTDLKDPSSDGKPDQRTSDATGENSSPFDSLKRRATGGPLSAGLSGPDSPWAATPQSATFGTMGAFGSFALGSGSSNEPSDKDKRPGFGSMRGESRFKGLLSKASAEESPSGIKEKPSLGNLGRLPEDDTAEANSRWEENRQPRQSRSVTNPYEDDILRGGSTGFGRDADPMTQVPGDIGFSAFGDTIRNLVAAHSNSQQQTPQQSRMQGHEPMSPTNTNPYQSPEGDMTNFDDGNPDQSDARRFNALGLGSHRDDPSADAFASLRGKNVSSAFDDRSQTSSTGPGRAFQGLTGVGGLPSIGGPSPWSGNPIGSIGTPSKERVGFPGGFGDSMFGSMADLQSPTLGSLGGPGGFGSSNAGTFPRSSKMGSMFPPAMQDQIREDRNRPDSAGDGMGGFRRDFDQQNPGSSGFFGDIGAYDPNRMPQGLEDSNMHDSGYPSAHPASFSANQPQTSSAPGSGLMSKVGTADDQPAQSQSTGSSNSNQLPASQQRQMVMPDRMRWIYRDPQGNTQGPWSGLEMHDWFKAGFFTAELQVKKLEDVEYEPLAQLVRRIGNSREPFLVPQIGVPHGPPVPSQGNNWPTSTTGGQVSGGVPQGSGAQPPFANSFPSFGTTLTAEQQNALERRKQEEQYLMARQKEHLAQQQVIMKQMALQGGPHSMHHGLQHHSSAHSLQSQPSFGSIASPSGYQPSPIQGPIQPPQNTAGFHDPSVRQPQPPSAGPNTASGEAEDLPPFFERMNINRGGQFSIGGGPFGGRLPEGPVQQPVGNMLQDRARLQAEQQQQMRLQGDAMPEFQNDERLQHFRALRNQAEDDLGFSTAQGPSSVPIGGRARARQDESDRQFAGYDQIPPIETFRNQSESPEPEMLSLSKQAQNVVAEQQAPAQSVWAKPDSAQPVVPPPQTASPLPAPSAQRRQNVADTLAADSRSQSQTPIEPLSASIAPWADKTVETSKGPSLREIQEAEARKAAQREGLAAGARRAQAELERQQATVAPPPAPGLPSSSNWANTTSPATPSAPGASVWSKPTNTKVPATPATSTKKTLAQIQKEEELRKQRAAAVVQAVNGGSPTVGGGKRYADLASKVAPVSPAAATNSAWTTVGSSGKVKAPTTVVATPVSAQRTVSGTVPVTTKSRPIATRAPGSAVTSQAGAQNKATDEFIKWAKGQLGKGLASGINVDEFIQSLLILPSETEIISDSVYANSQTLDGRRFAEEFVRRRKLADKGVIESGSNSNGSTPVDGKSTSSGGGWSEVAKKGPERKEETNSAFKVVAGKKKGRK